MAVVVFPMGFALAYLPNHKGVQSVRRMRPFRLREATARLQFTALYMTECSRLRLGIVVGYRFGWVDERTGAAVRKTAARK